MKAIGVASCSALYVFQSPSFPRNVGTPDSADIPAPVSEQTLFAASKISQTGPKFDWISILITTSGHKDTGMMPKTQTAKMKMSANREKEDNLEKLTEVNASFTRNHYIGHITMINLGGNNE
jgi:hypothetical protein